jgi:hypothetical protein
VESINLVPDEITENWPRWANYVLNAQNDDRIVFLSDTINLLGYWEGGRRILFDPDTFNEFLDHGFSLAEALGVKLWGVNSGKDSMRYRTYSPFSFLHLVARGVTCHIAPELRYDEMMGLAAPEDFWLRNIQQYHRTLRMNKFHYTMSNEIQEDELSDIRRLQAKWGEVVEIARQKQGKGEGVNLKFHLPIEGL